ncbi:MAG: hypothetical protein NZ556_06710 [Fimbriimonadales bacterium]|nr:hypothetical protein [Fimbriimonadales bacterium]
MRRDPRTIYAQTSDIKGRTYLEYRRDMKRKAIAELEALPWIEQVLQHHYRGQSVQVEKSGGDKFLWFLRAGGVSREPDYIANIGEQTQKIEFQYASAEALDFYDFKISKVARQQKKQRIPREDTLFLYVDKPSRKYALLTAEWIHKNAQVGEVAAWRAPGYRVPANVFRTQLQSDASLASLIRKIDAKNTLLDFQHELYEQQKELLKDQIEQAVMEDAEFALVPATSEGFYRACFILSAISRCPKHIETWINKAADFAESVQSLEQAFQAAFCLDYAYFCVPASQELNPTPFIQSINHLCGFVDRTHQPQRGVYSQGLADACAETRYALFVITVIEDMTQDILHYRGQSLGSKHRLRPIHKIYQSVKQPLKVAQFIQRECLRREGITP